MIARLIIMVLNPMQFGDALWQGLLRPWADQAAVELLAHIQEVEVCRLSLC